MTEYPKCFPYRKRNNSIENLVIALDSLPGIKTFCSTNAKYGINIWFKVSNSKEGLFFLTRCVDIRYWKYGYLWAIGLTVGDMFKNNILPVHYCLTSNKVKGRKAFIQAKSLIENMNYHLNHENFIKGFNIHTDKIKYINTVAQGRIDKLQKIKKKIK